MGPMRSPHAALASLEISVPWRASLRAPGAIALMIHVVTPFPVSPMSLNEYSRRGFSHWKA